MTPARTPIAMRPTDGSPRFATTHWSMVLDAADLDSESHREALRTLCEGYWQPLYAYARRMGHPPPAAEDLTQGFFAKLLEKNYLGIVDRQRGRFRWFLLTAFKGFMANEHDRSTALKRGGGTQAVSLDQTFGENAYRLEPADTLSPDHLYDRSWALTVITQSRDQLRREFELLGKLDRFDELEKHLPGDRTGRPYAELAAEFGTTEGALKQEMRRLKLRFAEILRNEVGRTVANPSEIDDEIAYLLEVVGRTS